MNTEPKPWDFPWHPKIWPGFNGQQQLNIALVGALEALGIALTFERAAVGREQIQCRLEDIRKSAALNVDALNMLEEVLAVLSGDDDQQGGES